MTIKYMIVKSAVKIYSITFDTSYGDIQLDIWDTVGQEKFGALRDSFYAGASGAIIMFDVTCTLSYANTIGRWCPHCTRICGDIPVAFCGNKVDIRNRSVPRKYINYQNGKQNYFYYDLSATSNYNIEKPFLFLIRKITGYATIIYIYINRKIYTNRQN